eukprot:symbB.v1.2.028212.t4/scaffold2925.1/size97224/2
MHLQTRTCGQNDTDVENSTTLSFVSTSLEDGLDVTLACYPLEDVTFRNPETCWIGPLQAQKDWDQSTLKVLSAEVICDDYEAAEECNLSQGIIYDHGFAVHEDIASAFWTNGTADWVQLAAIGIITWWLVSYFVTLYVAIRLWDTNPQASRDAIAQGSLRHAVGLLLVVLCYFSGWGSPRRGGWFYGPYCPYGEEEDKTRLTFSYFCFLGTGVLHVLVSAAAAMFHSVIVRRALYPDNIIVVSRKKVPTFLQGVLDACLHGEEPSIGYMWENGRTDDLRLKTWKQDLCKRHHNCVTIEIHIRPADSFSTETIQSLGYSFYARLKDLKPIKEGSVQVYQAVIRSHWIFQHCVFTGLFIERFCSNFFLLGFLHEIHFQHFGVNSACVRLEKRVRMLPQQELEKLCHDCYTLSTTHLTRVKDFRLRALDGMQQAENGPKAVEDNEEAAFRLVSETQWSKCAEVADSEREQEEPEEHENDSDSDEETDLLPNARLSVPSVPAETRVPENSPAVSVLSDPSLSVTDRWAKGKGSKEDWKGLLHKAHIFVLRSYLALSERDPQIRYVEEATRAFIEAWEQGSLNEDPIVTQTMLAKVRSLYNSHLHKALACLDFQSVDDLRAAAESSGGSGAQFGLLGPSIQKMMATHSRYLLQMAMAIGDRKALALALVESSRLMGELPDDLTATPKEPAAPSEKPVSLKVEEEEPAAPSEKPEPAAPSEKPVSLKVEEEEPAAPSEKPVSLKVEEEDPVEGSSVGENNDSGHGEDDLDRTDVLVGGDPWEPLQKAEAEGAGLADVTKLSFSQLLQMARTMYRESLLGDSQRLLSSDAARELLGDGDHGESWMRQQLAVMRTKQVGSLNSRAKRELESPKFIRALQTLFDLTTRQVITRDRQGKLPTRLKVVKVKRSINLDAYRAYFARRCEIEAAMARHPPGVRLDDCLTTGPSGCYLTKEMRSLQGLWIDSIGAHWLVEGNQVFRVAALAAQFLEPTKSNLFATEDHYQLKPLKPETSPKLDQPATCMDAAGIPQHAVSAVLQFVVEVKKRVKDDDDAEESLQDKAPVKDRWHGWFDGSGDRVMWHCEKRERSQWMRCETIQGFWRVFNSFVLLLSPRAFREGAALLDGKSRLGRARRGCVWFERELHLLSEEGRFVSTEEKPSEEPSFIMHWIGELYPIWVKSSNGFSIDSTTFKGFVDVEGAEMCLEPVGQEERPSLANFRPKRTLLSMRTTHVVQPFLSKIWAHRQLMSVELGVKELSSSANELWLFHGTREAAAECITENEFQVRMAGSNRGTMFGPGIYLADSVTKSDEYTDPDPTGLRTMILCRCTMGRAIRQEGGGRECMKVCQAGGFHSVKGRRAYNEYIVYDENQVYPEYIIWYRRVYNIE